MTVRRNAARCARASVGAVLIGLSALAWADVPVLAPDALEDQLAARAFCCVIDARDNAIRRRDPLQGARPWPDLGEIRPGTAVVVVAERLPKARRVAGEVAARHPGAHVLIAKDGIADWRVVAQARAAMPPPGMRFIIPRNTCDPAVTIMELRGAGAQESR